MRALVLGATGQLLVRELLRAGYGVTAIVRSPERLPKDLRDHAALSLAVGSPVEMEEDRLRHLVSDCDAAVSCLGHNVSFKGIYGHPRRLVTESARRVCRAIESNSPSSPVKFVLMNTAGNSNRDLDEKVSIAERVVVGMIRLLIPPHADNERAADLLRTEIGPNHPHIQWVVVRPDTLTDHEIVTDYDLFQSPTRSAIFNPGRTSRINVANFMSRLIMEEEPWGRWRGRMPVIYNREWSPSSRVDG